MAIFGFKKRKDEKLEQDAQMTKTLVDKKTAGKTSQKPIAVEKVKKTSKASDSKPSIPVLASDKASSTASVIKKPRITEKSGILSQGGVYTFEVSKNANKNSVKNAFIALYKVIPVNVSVINIPAKRVFIRGKKGIVLGFKKALITVKKGEKIDFV